MDSNVPQQPELPGEDNRLLQSLLFDSDLIQLGTVVEQPTVPALSSGWGNPSTDPLGVDVALSNALKTNEVTLSALNNQTTPNLALRPEQRSAVGGAPPQPMAALTGAASAPTTTTTTTTQQQQISQPPTSVKREPESPTLTASSHDHDAAIEQTHARLVAAAASNAAINGAGGPDTAAAAQAAADNFSDAPASPSVDYSKMSAEEVKLAKRLRRLRKNRESAQASRQRKRAYVENLERQVHNLAGERTGLTSQVDDLIVRNKALADEVEHLKTVIKNSNQLASYYAMST